MHFQLDFIFSAPLEPEVLSHMAFQAYHMQSIQMEKSKKYIEFSKYISW